MSPSSSLLSIDEDVTTISSTTTFEPILNVPAFITFLFIAIVFSVLIVRTNQVERAVQERNQRLQQLRTMKSKELENNDDTISTADIQRCLRDYESAVQKEESLRNIVPGVVRIIPPSAGNPNEEEARIIAKQLLGKEYDIGIPKQERYEERQLSPVATGALIIVGTILVALLAFLSLMYTGGGSGSHGDLIASSPVQEFL
jgi:hypothetical protein